MVSTYEVTQGSLSIDLTEDIIVVLDQTMERLKPILSICIHLVVARRWNILLLVSQFCPFNSLELFFSLLGDLVHLLPVQLLLVKVAAFEASIIATAAEAALTVDATSPPKGNGKTQKQQSCLKLHPVTGVL